MHSWTDRKTDSQSDRQTRSLCHLTLCLNLCVSHRQMGRKTDRQTDRHSRRSCFFSRSACSFIYFCLFFSIYSAVCCIHVVCMSVKCSHICYIHTYIHTYAEKEPIHAQINIETHEYCACKFTGSVKPQSLMIASFDDAVMRTSPSPLASMSAFCLPP
jgi:hypothetical protein